MQDSRKDETLMLLQDLLKNAKGFGATSADVVLSDSSSVTVNRRLGKPESIHRSEEADIGLRVFVGKRNAIVSSSDRTPEALTQMAERAVAMAQNVPEDIHAGIADSSDIATIFPDLDLYDPAEPSVEEMNSYADRAEQAARSVSGITNSDGAEFGCGNDTVYYVASNGFVGSYSSSGFSISVAVIAGKDTGMEEDYDFDTAAFLSDLEEPEEIGKRAGERAVSALHPRKGATGRVPVVFDNRISGGLIGSLAGAISGMAVARGTTLLKDKMGQQVFSSGITIIDDPFLKRGNRSHPFDGEGIAPKKRSIIDKGILTGWLLDLSSARQLGLKTTGNAARGSGSPPSPKPANFYMQPGCVTIDELIKEIDEGFYVTQMMGSGGNVVTGDYSRGAKGFWIERGQITYPVSEMTIAGNLKDMWKNCLPANDLKLKYGIDVPTIRIDGMMVAGT
ncbi:MAG: TldD/PmbA family protein [Alphaproteobacteria bacterium]|nr:TldD/PmbA family protein [Alphaproteobacteria bacterium]MCK5554874.1 TldD/PmbA family protein [Alphaproteobacteria bacterium]MCK5658670.1 TldD/PmbA family protein [Alphaproteobacteria bacterium]